MGIFHPVLIIIFLIRQLPLKWLFSLRLIIDGYERPYYAYGIYQAAILASRLNIKKISVMEFGVAAGTGLVVMEKLSALISEKTGVEIEVYGFDLAVGLPTASDYRDLPYIWQKGFYKMDEDALRKKISSRTKLVLGDVRETVPKFVKKTFPPIGFVAFDLDYYSSTASALNIFSGKQTTLLPRVHCYFDDIVGNENEIMSRHVGELLAIEEFNSKHKSQKLDPIYGLESKRVVRATWNQMMFVLHTFNHPMYNTYIFPEKDRQIPLD